MAVVDVYDAASTRRLYRPSVTHDDAVGVIVKGRGSHFDPDVVDAFLKVADVLHNVSVESEAPEGDHT
jgi:putative two-component system response regulator